MKKLVLSLSLSLSLLSAGAVSAADMAVKTRPIAVDPSYNWTGWYVGLNAGAAINDSRYTLLPTGNFLGPAWVGGNPLRTDSGRFDRTSFTGGGQIGYNYQVGKWVWGVEADINYGGEGQTDNVNRPFAAPLVGSFVHGVSERLDWFGTLRGRLGFTPADRVLLYATGGLAYGRVSSSSNLLATADGDTYIGSASSTRVGWTAGGGAEWALSNNWTVKAEYLYVDLGSFSYSDPNVPLIFPGFTYQTDVTAREHIVRLGLNYRFGGVAPVVAKY